MARIRTVKPGVFRHEELFQLEREHRLPLRTAWIGLFTVADREGRFEWKPKQLKLDVLPWDDLDFEEVLNIFHTTGFIVRYRKDGKDFAHIPSWKEHQLVNHREQPSTCPDPAECEISPRVAVMPGHAQANPGGREGKVAEQEGVGKGVTAADASAPVDGLTLFPIVDKSVNGRVWESYALAYQKRYQSEPVRNAKVNSQIKQFVARIPGDAAALVAAFYCGHDAAYYVSRMHPVGLLVSDAEKLYTEWNTNRKMTATMARQLESGDGARGQMQRILRGEL